MVTDTIWSGGKGNPYLTATMFAVALVCRWVNIDDTSMNPNAFLDAKNWLVLINAISFYLTLTPPNRPVPKSGRIMRSTYEKTILVRLLNHGRHSFARSAYCTS